MRMVSLQLAFQLLDTQPEIRDKPTALTLPQVRGDVRFEGVCVFQYSKRADTLKQVTFGVQAGQVIAIVGPTGTARPRCSACCPGSAESQRWTDYPGWA